MRNDTIFVFTEAFQKTSDTVNQRSKTKLFQHFSICTEYRNTKGLTDLHLKLTNDNHVTIQPLPAGATLKH